MKKIFNFAAIVASAIFLSSCSSNLLTQSSPVYSLTNSKVSNGYIETKLDIKGEANGEATGKFKRLGRGIVGRNQSYVDDNNSMSIATTRVDKAKALALYDAVKKSGCDIILAPIYTVNIHKGFLLRDRFKVSVSGKAANIVGVTQKGIDPNKVQNK